MGTAFEIVSGRVTNTSGVLTTVTNATGDTTAVRSFPFESGAWLYNAWGLAESTQTLRIRSPRMHDQVENLRFKLLANDPKAQFAEGMRQRLFPQDVLTVQASSGAADTSAVSMLVYYNDLPGIQARLFMWDEILPRIEHVLTIEQTITSSATAGDYGGQQTIVADFDLLKANTDYAILGYTSTLGVASVGITSPDFGNLRVGGPGTNEAIETRNWFKRLSDKLQTPTIPVFNASNKDSTLVDVLDNTASQATIIEVVCAQLSR